MLIEKSRADIEAVDKNGNTCVHVAATPEVILILLRAGARRLNPRQVKNKAGKTAYEIQTPENRTTINDFVLFCRRFDVASLSTPEHATATSVILRATDTHFYEEDEGGEESRLTLSRVSDNHVDEEGSEGAEEDGARMSAVARLSRPPSDPPPYQSTVKLSRDVVIKLMKEEAVFNRELEQRIGLDPDFVVHVVCSSKDPDISENWAKELYKLGKWKDYTFGIVMPAAQRNLMIILLQEKPTIDEIRQMFLSLGCSIGHLHAQGRIHGDIKPLNIVRAYDETIMLIDLDMTVALGEPVGAKQLSTAFVGPESTYERVDSEGAVMAEFRKADAYPNGVAKVPFKAPAEAEYGGGEGYASDGLLLASPTFDIWSYGVVLYFAIAQKPLLETTGSDQLRGQAERVKLAKWTAADLTHAINDLDHGEPGNYKFYNHSLFILILF